MDARLDSGTPMNEYIRGSHHAVKLPKPNGTYGYLDQVRVWLLVPLTRAETAWLRSECAAVFYKTRHSRFPGHYEQRLHLYRPSREALCWIDRRRGVLVNYAEVAFDLVYQSRADAWDADEFYRYHLIRPWHNRQYGVRCVQREAREDAAPHRDPEATTRYDGDRSSSRGLVLYREKCSRVTREPHCVHFEVRLNGKSAVEAGRVRYPIVDFDFEWFFEKHLTGFEPISYEAFGRRFRNRVNGTRSRKAPMRTLGARLSNVDGRLGGALLNGYATLQEAVDRVGGLGACRNVLRAIGSPRVRNGISC